MQILSWLLIILDCYKTFNSSLEIFPTPGGLLASDLTLFGQDKQEDDKEEIALDKNKNESYSSVCLTVIYTLPNNNMIFKVF